MIETLNNNNVILNEDIIDFSDLTSQTEIKHIKNLTERLNIKSLKIQNDNRQSENPLNLKLNNTSEIFKDIPRDEENLLPQVSKQNTKPLIFNNLLENLIHRITTILERNSDKNFEITKTSTPMIYQAMVNILHYKAKVELNESLKSFVDDPNKYYELDFNQYTRVHKLPNQLAKIKNNQYIKSLIYFGANKAASNEFIKIDSKFKLSDVEQKNVKEALENIFKNTLLKSNESEIISSAKQLRETLILNRIKKYFSKDELIKLYQNKENFSSILENYNKEEFEAHLKQNFHLDEVKLARLCKIVERFKLAENDLSSIEYKVDDLICASLHNEIANEIKLFNNVEEITFNGNEVLWRGLLLPEDFDINNIFNTTHRPIKGHGSFLDFHVVNKFSGNITTDYNAVTSTSYHLGVALRFSVNNPYERSGESYILEIHPKTGQQGIAMLSYDALTAGEHEFALDQISSHDIYGAYKIQALNSNSYKVIQFYKNPTYIKRELDKNYSSEIKVDSKIVLNPLTGKMVIWNDNTKHEYNPFKPEIITHLKDFEELDNGKELSDNSTSTPQIAVTKEKLAEYHQNQKDELLFDMFKEEEPSTSILNFYTSTLENYDEIALENSNTQEFQLENNNINLTYEGSNAELVDINNTLPSLAEYLPENNDVILVG
ncbi:MAG: hypothetical protein J0H68_08585 [Sphingobacteriia bacterium]|nr:hypothetical protein [Sphingobacteriia bacterium]